MCLTDGNPEKSQNVYLLIKLEVPPDLIDNYCMMNKKEYITYGDKKLDEMCTEVTSTNNAIAFVTSVSEMIAAYNERGIDYDMDELLNEAYENEYNDMKTEDLPYALDIFNEGFDDRDAGWLNWECKAIRKWIGNKYYA